MRNAELLLMLSQLCVVFDAVAVTMLFRPLPRSAAPACYFKLTMTSFVFLLHQTYLVCRPAQNDMLCKISFYTLCVDSFLLNAVVNYRPLLIWPMSE